MPIKFVSVGAVAGSSGATFTITPPATQTDDIMICALTANDGTSLDNSTNFPAAWTVNNTGPSGADPTVPRSILAIKRAVGVEGAFSITRAGTTLGNVVARIAVYRGCLKNITPPSTAALEADAGIGNTSTQCTSGVFPGSIFASFTTLPPNCMAVFTNHMVGNTTGFSNFQIRNVAGNPVLTERFLQNGDIQGTGASKTFVDLADGVLPFGCTNPVSNPIVATSTVSAAERAVGWIIYLFPQPAIATKSAKILRSPSKIVTGSI